MRAVLVEQYDSIENIQIGEVETPAIAARQEIGGQFTYFTHSES